MLKSQKGLSTILLFFGIIIIIALGFISYKLLIEPANNHRAITPRENEAITKDSFSNKTPAPAQSSESGSTGAIGLANPASGNCIKEGGTLSIMKNGVGAEFGLCQFEDDQACEEWALMRGQCPVGGVKTIGYDNDQQSYCAWIGGTTEAVENDQCTLPGGKVCPVDELWNGSCY